MLTMANKKTVIVRLCKTPYGWRRYPAVLDKSGRIKPGLVLADGEEREFPVGRYQVRSYAGRRTVYKDVGDDPGRALAEQREQSEYLVTRSSLRKESVNVPFAKSALERVKEVALNEGLSVEEWIASIIYQKIGSLSATS
jgi:hypothetical protein